LLPSLLLMTFANTALAQGFSRATAVGAVRRPCSRRTPS